MDRIRLLQAVEEELLLGSTFAHNPRTTVKFLIQLVVLMRYPDEINVFTLASMSFCAAVAQKVAVNGLPHPLTLVQRSPKWQTV